MKLRPADLPLEQRPAVVDRLAALLSMPADDINATIDGNPGSTFDLVRIATDVDERTARLISEAGFDLPGVEVAVEARRQYADGPLLSQILGYTGPVSGEQLLELKPDGYLPDDLIGKAGIEAQYETNLRGIYGTQSVERDASGRKTQVLQTIAQAQPGDSLTLTIDTKEQKNAQKALLWAMKKVGIKRGVVIVMNPQTGEILALVSLPTYDNNQFARGISNKDYAKLLKNPDKPLLNHATQAHYPPGSTYKLVAGTGALADKKITPSTKVRDARATSRSASTRFYDWNHRGFGACNIYCGFGHSSDTFFFQMAGKLGIDRLGYWAKQYGFGAPTGIDLPGEVSGIVPTNQWKQDTLGAPDLPRRDLPGRDRPGLRRRHADPADQRLRRAGQRRHALPAPDRARHRRPRRHGRPAVQAEGHPQAEGAGERPQGRCATPPAARSPCATPTTWSTCRSRSPASPGRPSSGRATARAACRSTPGSSASCPKDARHGSFNEHRLAARRPRLRLRLADEGQRRDRDRQVLPPAALRDQEGLPPPRPAQARQLLPEQLMGVIRAEPARITDWAAKSVGAAWRAFDLQLTTYAALLVAIGLVMAYTNSVEQGVVPLEAGTTFTRGLMWAAIAVVVFVHRDGLRLPLAPDACLADLRPPDRPARPDPGDRQRRRQLVALGHDRSADLPVQRDRQDPDDHRARQLPGGAGRAGSTPCRR